MAFWVITFGWQFRYLNYWLDGEIVWQSLEITRQQLQLCLQSCLCTIIYSFHKIPQYSSLNVTVNGFHKQNDLITQNVNKGRPTHAYKRALLLLTSEWTNILGLFEPFETLNVLGITTLLINIFNIQVIIYPVLWEFSEVVSFIEISSPFREVGTNMN